MTTTTPWGPGHPEYDRLQALSRFTPGVTVRFRRPPAGVSPDSLWVVTAVNAKTLTLFPLGGGSTRYWRAAPASVEIVDVANRLAETA